MAVRHCFACLRIYFPGLTECCGVFDPHLNPLPEGEADDEVAGEGYPIAAKLNSKINYG